MASTKTPTFEDVNPATDPPKSPILNAAQRTKRAREYEDKVDGLLGNIMEVCVASERTVADGAAILAYGPAFSSKAGDLADADAHVRRVIDIITAGSENPYLAFGLAALPLVAQVLRNHETEDMGRMLDVKIPFTKRSFKLKLRFKLRNPFLRSVTKDPAFLNKSVFENPEIAAALAANGVDVAYRPAKATRGR